MQELGSPGGASEETDRLGQHPAGSPGGDWAEPTFKPGDRVAGRYRVVRLVGEGGMGEVYEALDEELHDRVALKTVRPEIAADPWVQLAFKREIHLARKVTHPNVCRMYDLGFHGATMFLTMEYLAGETLSERLRRTGKLGTRQAAPLLEQIAGALDAAHAAGVLHGDLKPGNVMLVSGREGERAVVTDFGLAVWRQPVQHLLQNDARVMGSPAYMAAEAVTAPARLVASDVYALGVLLYRLLTGRLPFSDEEPDPVGAIRRRGLPPSPRTIVPDLDRRWARAVLRCLEPRPADRHRRAGDVARAASPRRSGRALLVAAALLVVAVTLVEVASHPAPPEAPRVAVQPIVNVSGARDHDWMSAGLAEMLATELGAGGRAHATPGPRADAGLVLAGGYTVGAGRVTLRLRLEDPASQVTRATVEEEGSEEELTALVVRAAGRLRERLGVRVLDDGEAAQARAALPRSTRAARHFVAGIRLTRRFECAAAIPELEQAVAAEPGFAAAHEALAEAHWYLGDLGPARAAARRAVDLASTLPEEARLAAQSRYWQIAGEPHQQVAVLEPLWRAHPDDLEIGVAFLFALRRSLAPLERARRQLDELRRLPAPLGDDPRIDMVDLWLAVIRPNREARRLADRLIRRAGADGALPMLAEGVGALATVLWTDGDLRGAVAQFRTARALVQQLGDRHGEAYNRSTAALVLVDGGWLDEALAELGPEDGWPVGRGVENLRPAVANLVALERGDLAQADRGYRAALEAARSRSVVRGFEQADAELGLARTQLAAGDLAGARRHAESAHEIYVELPYPGGIAYSASVLAEVELGRGAAALATVRILEAQGIWRVREARFEVARLDVLLSRAALAAGDPARALASARAAHAFFGQQLLPDDRALAGVALARALDAAGDRDAARAALHAARSDAAGTRRAPVRLAVDEAVLRLEPRR